MPIEYQIYLPIVLLVSIILLSKAKNKAFIGLFLFWLFGSPFFLNPSYAISLNFFGIDLQPNRLLFLVLTPILFISILTPNRYLLPGDPSKSTGLRLYEKLLLGFIIVVTFALVLNISSLGSRIVFAAVTNIITFIVVYFCIKKFINKDDFVLFQIAILTLGSISAVVAVYQFFINPEFFRLGDVRGAFLGYYRSNGLFTAEYDQGLFLILSIIVAMSLNLKWFIKIFYIAIVCDGVFVTMHRLSWVAFIITIGLIWFLYLRKIYFMYILVPLVLLFFIVGALIIPWPKLVISEFGYNLITDRILSDTLSVRFSQYIFSIYMIKEYPLGIGNYSNPIYDQEAVNLGVPLMTTQENLSKHALIVHNGFLSAGVNYGILGLILFSLFIFASIITFLKKSKQNGKNWYPLFIIMIVFLIFNLTNDFSFLGTQISVAIAWLLGGYVSVINLDHSSNSPNHPSI